MPFGARRTMTQDEDSSNQDEEEDQKNNQEALKEAIRLFIFELLKDNN